MRRSLFFKNAKMTFLAAASILAGPALVTAQSPSADIVAAREGRTVLWYQTGTNMKLEHVGYTNPWKETGLSVAAFPRDINDDGKVDLLAGSDKGRLRWLSLDKAEKPGVVLNTSYVMNNAKFNGIAIGNVDGDGDPDFVAARSAANDQGSALLAWYEIDLSQKPPYPGTGMIKRQAHTNVTKVNGYYDVAFIPFDVGNDGKRDILAARGGEKPGGGLLGVFEIDPKTKTIKRTDHHTLGYDNFIYAIDVVRTDLLDNRKLDIIIGRNDYISWYEYTKPGGGGEAFTRRGLLRTGVDTYDVVVTNLDNDAAPDVLAAQEGGTLAWYELDNMTANNDGSGDEFVRRGYYRDGSHHNFKGLAVKDLNGDGAKEIVVARDRDLEKPASPGALLLLGVDSSNDFAGQDATPDSGDEFILKDNVTVAETGYQDVDFVPSSVVPDGK